MFQSWRIQLREAEVALHAERLEEAQTLLRSGELAQYAPAKRLLARLGKKLVRRGAEQLKLGNTEAGWRDLRAAREAGVSFREADPLHKALCDRGLGEVEQALSADNLDAAAEAVAILERRGGDGARFRQSKLVVSMLLQARRAWREARFAAAAEAVATAATTRPDLAAVKAWQRRIEGDSQAWQALRKQFYDAWEKENWSAAVVAADDMLALAADDACTRQAREHAWQRFCVAGPSRTAADTVSEAGANAMEAQSPRNSRHKTLPLNRRSNAPQFRACPGDLELAAPSATPGADVRPLAGDQYQALNGERWPGRARSLSAAAAPPELPERGSSERAARFVIWVDGVGGFLVCEGDEFTIGQPIPGVDIPILGDLSRRHASIRRSGEGYLIEARRETWLSGRPVSAVTMINDGNELQLGSGVRLRFRRPNSLSSTARLDFASRHRTQPSVDGIVLLADCAILGPGPQCHIVCPDWEHNLILYRQQGQLCCRCEVPLRVDGKDCGHQAVIHRGARIETDSFALVLEELVDLAAGA